jgi:hypothetical protein
MTRKELENLKEGDIVRHKLHSNPVIITGNYKDYVIGVRTYHISNPDEWEVIKKGCN